MGVSTVSCPLPDAPFNIFQRYEVKVQFATGYDGVAPGQAATFDPQQNICSDEFELAMFAPVVQNTGISVSGRSSITNHLINNETEFGNITDFTVEFWYGEHVQTQHQFGCC